MSKIHFETGYLWRKHRKIKINITFEQNIFHNFQSKCNFVKHCKGEKILFISVYLGYIKCCRKIMTFRKAKLLLCMYVQVWTLRVDTLNKHIKKSSSSLLFHSSSRHLSMRCSPVQSWTSSLSSIKALRSSRN